MMSGVYIRSDKHKRKIGEANKGKICSKDKKEKIREKMIGNINGKANKGKHHREETKQKLREARKGKHLSEETKQKLREARKGKHLSEETKQKMREARKGKHHTEEARKKMRFGMIKYIKEVCGSVRPNLGRNETDILNDYEDKIGYKIVRQFECEGFFIDGYVPELNLCIEIDEPYHEKQLEEDEAREIIIKNKLGCSFVRIEDKLKPTIQGKI